MFQRPDRLWHLPADYTPEISVLIDAFDGEYLLLEREDVRQIGQDRFSDF
jgi:hypothetical protein